MYPRLAGRQPAASTGTRKVTPSTRLTLATVGFIVAWLAFACYAIAYLISR